MINRIHNYLRVRYQAYESVSIPPFTLFFADSEESLHPGCAIPDEPTHGDLSIALQSARDAFAQRGAAPRIRYLDTFSSNLTQSLHENNFKLIEQSLVMVCTPESYRPAPALPGLSTLILSHDSDLEDVRQSLHTHSLGFSPQDTQTLATDPELFRRSLIDSRAFVVRLNDKPVTTGMFMDAADGVTELTAIATVPEYRRRGFGAYLTGYMAQIAFARQMDMVFLLTPDDETASVYKRVGFHTRAALLTYGAE